MSATIDSIFHYMKDHLELSVDRVIHPNSMQINISGSKSAIRYHTEPDYSSLCVKYVTKNVKTQIKQEIARLYEENRYLLESNVLSDNERKIYNSTTPQASYHPFG